MDTGVAVTIAGTDYSSSALNGVRIQVGRDNVDAIIQPHAAAVELLHRDVPAVDPNGFEIGPERQLVFGRLINDEAGLLVERDGGLISYGNLQSDARQSRVKCFDRGSSQKSRTEVPTSKSFRNRQAMNV